MLSTNCVVQRASNRAPFVFLTYQIVLPILFIIFSSQVEADTPANSCTANHFNETVKVNFVYDGDTVELTDGRKLRLIGINTPERGRDGQADEPFYKPAKEQLKNIIEQNKRQLKLLYGREQHDKYNRLLAHIFTPDGVNITAMLLQNGLGFNIAVPPNIQFLKCYQLAESRAKQLKHGIWGHSFGQPVDAATLALFTQGFHQVTGTIEHISESHSSLWLNLSRTLAIRIPKKDLIYFTTYQPASLLRKRIIASSWIYTQNNEQRMTIRHPASLQILNTD